jgi:hypothetical protein
MEEHIETRKEDAQQMALDAEKKSFLATRFLRRREGFPRRDAFGKDGS